MPKIWYAPEEYNGHKIHCEKAYHIDGSGVTIFCYISHSNISFRGRKVGDPYAVTNGATKEEAVEKAKQKIKETIEYLEHKPKRRSATQKLQDIMG